MKRISVLIVLACLLLMGCEKKQPLVYTVNKSAELREYESEVEAEAAFEKARIEQSLAESERAAAEAASQIPEVWRKKSLDGARRKVRGIYLTDTTAGSRRMESIIEHIDATEINAVVIDIKNDDGRIAYQMESPAVQALGSAVDTISDIHGLLRELKEHDIYVIARIVSFRDPYLETVRPEWMYQLSDGSVYHDAAGLSWVNPYKREYWDYLKEIIAQCAHDGFDELQFDYVRFCTERSVGDVVFSPEDTEEKDKTEIITEFVHFLSDSCAENQILMSADVFGTIIGSYVDSKAVGQDYSLLSEAVDYLCPMIYPSHYGDGNFGLEHPDTEPYKTILGALGASKRALGEEKGVNRKNVNDENADTSDNAAAPQAVVRPWLQGFTASYLSHHINYGPEQLRAQIQAVYDSGHEEWLIWNASNNYDWSAFAVE